MATLLKADKSTVINGVKVNEFLLTKHNQNKISMPTVSMAGKVIGVTIHNTDDLPNVEDDAEQYTRATYNGNMKDVRVHYYVDDLCAWQNLPLDLSGWHAADGGGNGNRKTIAIECIMNDKDKKHDSIAEDNCAKLAAYLLHKYGLSINNLYTHTYWLNIKAGKKGTVDELNVMKNSYKNCPAYIIPHWQSFKKLVKKYLDALNNGTAPITNNTSTTASNPKSSGSFAIPVTWKNGSTPEIVSSYDDMHCKVGVLSKYESAKCYGKSNSKYAIVYDLDGTNKHKAGFVAYAGKVSSTPTDFKIWKNGSTPEPVYADTAKRTKIGYLNPYEVANCLTKVDGMYLVLYKVDGKSNHKLGFVAYSGGC